MEGIREPWLAAGGRLEGFRAGLTRLVEQALGVRPGEGRRTSLLFAYLLCASAIFILGRTVRDTLFLSRYPISALPWMFVFFGIVSAVVAIAYGSVADRYPRRLQILVTLGVGAGSYVGVWFLVRGQREWVYPVFYIWTEVVANLLIMQFWTLANDLHDARSGKRLFGTIGSARILGVIACGLAVGAVVKAIGTAQLLLVLVGLMAAVGVLATLLTSGLGKPKGRPKTSGQPPARPQPVLKNPYVRSLAGVILLIFVALTVGDYQFKIVAREAFREDDLARFFSLFYAGAGAAGFLFQIAFTPRILRRLGVLAGMLAMPLCFLSSSLAFLLFGGLAFVSLMKFSDNGLQFTIHETSLQVLYVPFPQGLKARARALLDTAVKPLSYGLGGLALVFLADKVPVRGLTFLTVPVALLWIALLPAVRKKYLQALEASLSGRAGAFSADEEAIQASEVRKLLLRCLESGDPVLVLHALERIREERSPSVRAALVKLMGHGDPRVRREALVRMGEAAHPDFLPAVRGALGDPDPKVCAAALEALCALEGDDAVDEAEGFVQHRDRSLRASAIVGLVRHGGIEGAVIGGARLEGLLTSPDPKRRVEAAEILHRLGRPGYRPLRKLLQDEEARVRKAALKAASSVADARLMPLLLEALRGEGSRKRAARALAAVGQPAFGPLLDILRDEGEPREVRLLIPRILKQISSPEGYGALLEDPLPEEGQVRLRLYSCAGHLREAMGLPPRPAAEVGKRLEAEIGEAMRLQALWEAARPVYGTRLLEDSVALSLRRAMHRVFRILELRYARQELDMVWRALRMPGRSANALEVLDTLLEPSLKGVALPFVEAVASGRLAVAPDGTPEAFLVARCAHRNPYTAFVALNAAAQHGETRALPAAIVALGRPEPIAREGALRALAALLPEGEVAGRAGGLRGDPDPVVAGLAEALAEGREAPMFSTVEKVLFLMSVPIFSGLPGEDLAPLARVAEVHGYSEGSVIFKEGEEGDALYVIMRGQVAIEKRGVRIASLGARECFGEMSVLDAVTRSADARASAETEVLRISSDLFYDILHEQPEIAEAVIRVLTRRLRESEERRVEPPAGEV